MRFNFVKWQPQDNKVTGIGASKGYEDKHLLKDRSRHPVLRLSIVVFHIALIESSITATLAFTTLGTIFRLWSVLWLFDSLEIYTLHLSCNFFERINLGIRLNRLYQRLLIIISLPSIIIYLGRDVIIFLV